MARRRRSLFVLPVIVFTCSIVAGFYGPKVEVASAAAPSEDLDSDVRNFSKVLSLVEANFADKVSAGKDRLQGRDSRACCARWTRTPTSSMRANTS